MSDQTRRSTGWQLDRSAPEAYERYLVPAIFVPWAERLVDRADVGNGDRVLDVACGTGVVARHAAARVGDAGSVVGLDVNEGMLEVAARTAAEAQLEIEWRAGDATELPFSGGGFDAVCCQQALQFVDDPTAALEEMGRVCGSDGCVVISVWRPLEHQPGYVVLAEALERHVGEDAGAMMRSPFPAWHEEELRTFARDAGFGEVSVAIEIGSVRYPSAEEFVRREAASSPLAEPISGVGRNVRDALVSAVEDGLEAYTDDDGIVFPIESFVLTLR
ncbi:methyltransferase domain-containing protein [Natronococcus sp. A-GB7]|uniref:class I SAM-dependent methyltransferase n=1 Tax=Natronococcus sp. A-GB7 TaxID=3037649 RepID=UPI00241E5B8B|nr:methyltransferase domain-containing protein [Natronococcus sp. A-GB7]MDG5818398.1 methyltransferase domain-containing protein [Natronococcus sp. A-GB7]